MRCAGKSVKDLLVGCHSHCEALHLDSKRDVKVLGDVGFRPELDSVVLLKSDALESFPTEKGIVADERRNVSATDSEPWLC